MLQIGQIIPDTEAEGPGRRFAVWVQGCPLRCPGCCNPQMLPFEGGEPMTVDELVDRALAMKATGVSGVSLLGGEPFAQAKELALFAERVRAANLDVMIYSGFTLAELQAKASGEKANANGRGQGDGRADGAVKGGEKVGEKIEGATTEGGERGSEKGDEGVRALLAQCDLLVDGPYDRNLPEHCRSDGQRARRWIGSTNQVMHFLTDRYRPDDERMFEKNSVEIRLSRDGELVVNGWPSLAAGIGIKPFVRLSKTKPQ